MKKSRKRLLISSVAMLLVAMLALGTATFAWFTQNTTATADTLYATTIKASSLKISKHDHAWGNSVTYTLGSSSSAQVMFPASSANGTTWCEAISDSASSGTYKASTAKSVTPSNSTAKFVYKDQLNVQNAGAAGAPAINNVKISVSWPTNTAAYARFALVPTDDANFVNAAFDFPTDKSFVDYVYAQSVVTYDGRSDDTTTASITTKAGDIEIGTLNAGDAKYFTLFVWFEGQDANCIDNNAGQLINGLSFTVTGTPAAN